jgi:hypothetical protein
MRFTKSMYVHVYSSMYAFVVFSQATKHRILDHFYSNRIFQLFRF